MYRLCRIAILTRAYRLTVASSLFVFVVHWADVRRATYLCPDCTKTMHKSWNVNVLFVIHVNFDHMWAEHYPVTLIKGFTVSLVFMVCNINSFLQSSYATMMGATLENLPPILKESIRLQLLFELHP